MGRIVDASFFADTPAPTRGRIVDSSFFMPEASEPAKLTDMERGQALGQTMLKGATFGLGDDVANYANAAIDYYLTDHQQPQSFDEALQRRETEASDLVNRYRDQAPVIAYGSEIGTSLLSPAVGLKAVSGLGSVAKSNTILNALKGTTAINNPLTRGAVAGATEAGIYGYGEDQDVLDSMQTGGILGGGLGAVTGTINKGLSSLKGAGEKLQRSAVGITAADVKKAGTGLGAYTRRVSGDNPLIQAFENIKSRGELPENFDPTILRNKGFNIIDQNQDKITKMVSEADRELKDVIIPDFSNAQRYIDSLSGTEKTKAIASLGDEMEALNMQLDGSLTSVQKAKISFNKKTYSGKEDAYAKGLDRAITSDLKNTVENTIDSLVRQRKLPKSYLSQVADVNNITKEWTMLDDILARSEAREQSQDLGKKAIDFLKTTGGFGTAILSGAYTMNPAIAVGGIAGSALMNKALLDPSGRFITGGNLQKLSGKSVPKFGVGAIAVQEEDYSPLITESKQDQNQSTPIASNSREIGSLINTASNRTITPAIEKDKVFDISLDRNAIRKLNQGDNIDRALTKSELKAQGREDLIQEMDKVKNYDDLVNRVVMAESSGNAKAVGPNTRFGRAKGAMQLLDSTAKETMKEMGLDPKDWNPFDKELNIAVGSHYLDKLINRYSGNEVLALAAYNWGMGNVDAYLKGKRSFIPDETKKYVKKITGQSLAMELNQARRVVA